MCTSCTASSASPSLVRAHVPLFNWSSADYMYVIDYMYINVDPSDLVNSFEIARRFMVDVSCD